MRVLLVLPVARADATEESCNTEQRGHRKVVSQEWSQPRRERPGEFLAASVAPATHAFR